MTSLFKFSVMLLALASSIAIPQQAPTQGTSERFWIAGRYDGNRVIVYFDAVKLGLPTPPGATNIPLPVADLFFTPVALPEAYVSQFQTRPSAERFKPGDRYDLLLGDGLVETFTLTTLVGFHSDEGTGNDSYIGALGTMDQEQALIFKGNYFVATRHADRPARTGIYPNTATRISQPIPFNVQTQITSMMQDRLKSEARLAVSPAAARLSPAFVIEPFTVAGGGLRYHVRAEWRTGRDSGYDLRHAFAAWMTSEPALRILATEQLSFASDANVEEELLTVVDLGQGRTGALLSLHNMASRGMRLVEYRDGVPLSQMRTLQIVTVGD